MNIFACFSLIWLATFRLKAFTLHSWLLWAELVFSLLLLPGFCVGIYEGVTRTTRPSPQKSSSFVKKSIKTRIAMAMRLVTSRLRSRLFLRKPDSNRQSTRADDNRGTARIWGTLLTGILVGGWALWLGVVIPDHQQIRAQQKEIDNLQRQLRSQDDAPSGLVVMHGVQVLDRISDRTFKAQVENPATGEWTEFYVTSCPNHPLSTNEIQAGVTLELLQYVEDHTHSCQILDGRWAGYTLLRDKGSPILTAFKEHYDFSR